MTEIAIADEMTLIGVCLVRAQQVELALYGIAAHVTHLPGLTGDRRFRNLDAEAFLRGDPATLKATLGALVETVGDDFLLDRRELENFVDDRNLLVHNYWRTFHWEVRGAAKRRDRQAFLIEFAAKASDLHDVLRGLIATMATVMAERDGVSVETVLDAEQLGLREKYISHVANRIDK